LFQIATDSKLPHVVIRAFAKGAACKLEDRKLLAFTAEQHDALKRANGSALRRVTVKPIGYDRNSRQSEKAPDPRFRFDSIDTIPYWYQPATAVFAGVTLDEFTAAAEYWIVDRWKVIGEISYGKNEPRRHRFSDRDWHLWSNSHGSAPTIERYSTYLEWHAMCCAVGELMHTRPLAKAELPRDGYEAWLSRYKVPCPPHWLADLRGPEPLETRFWFPPAQGIDEWINSAGDEDFLREMGIGGTRNGMLIVRASHDTRSSVFASEAEIRTALVEPETASALVRALQTVNEPYNYKIPDEGDSLEINEPPYRLVGWLSAPQSRSGIDDGDPLRNEMRGFQHEPGRRHTKLFERCVSGDGRVLWHRAGAEAYVYEEWSDRRRGMDEGPIDVAQSVGSRLWISADVLQEYLRQARLDLIAEIALRKEKRERDHRHDDPKEDSASRYDRVLIFRQNGAIEAAEGRIGTWHTSGS
jgi:hypothetical protein